MSGHLKNYTARIKSLASDPTPESVKAATEELLLRAAAKPAFQLGTIAYTDPHTFLLEVAVNLQKDPLRHLLLGLETKLPLQVEQLGYGWIVSGSDAPARPGLVNSLRSDPYAKAGPQRETAKVYAFNQRGLIRFLFSLGLLLGLLTVSVASPHLWEMSSSGNALIVNLVVIGLMGLSILLGAPLMPWLYVSRVVCDSEGMEIKYWLKRMPIRLDWKQISGLDLQFGRLIIHFNSHSCRFLASKELGLNETPLLVKTITQRASLHFVEVNMSLVSYRRYDAPG